MFKIILITLICDWLVGSNNGLARELRRMMVYINTVENKTSEVDWILKWQMQHSMSKVIDWLFLIFDEQIEKDEGSD